MDYLPTTTNLSETGITRKISFVLDALCIPCNIVVAFHHDHIFVPYTMRLKALSALTSLGTGE
ncbi:hypothetical protein [Fulvivirga lutea]|uniref:Uncharacterized protein n=1 Tax=Fulvivirga lutea TaxID=2810512 RepID=A0A974WL03_9BACT|nr:hypothetical protein [Fulvivirga lutea]QSE99152.1 hypothetical protein JR347_08705 [Fulvivirga lutea]